MNRQKHIHLIAVCGTGMGALAGMLKEKGFRVSGSDRNIYPPMSQQLERLGVELVLGYGPDNLRERPDLVIVGNAVSKTNPEVQAMLSQGIEYLSLPEALNRFFLKDKVPLVIAGTHGKTTTSSLMAWVLESCGYDPGFFIGGIPINFGQNYKAGQGTYFVIEGDEYDTAFFDKGPKFLHYETKAAILTSIEFDHGDIYADLDSVKKAFKSFLKRLPEDGFLAAGIDFPEVESMVHEANCLVETYGFSGNAAWRAEITRADQEKVHFSCYRRGTKMSKFTWSLPGRHNIQNALAVIALASHLGMGMEQIVSAINTFRGVKRRQEVLARIKGVTVIDDFAHHPTAVYETLLALRQRFNRQKLWAVFEPRTNTSSRRFFQKEYVRAFSPADRIIVTQVYNREQIAPEERFSPEELVKDLRAIGKEAFFIERTDQIGAFLKSQFSGDDVVVIMHVGDGVNLLT